MTDHSLVFGQQKAGDELHLILQRSDTAGPPRRSDSISGRVPASLNRGPGLQHWVPAAEQGHRTSPSRFC